MYDREASTLYLKKSTTTYTSFNDQSQNPTDEDWLRLTRALKYLNGTKVLELLRRIGDKIIINAHIDASFGVHEQDG